MAIFDPAYEIVKANEGGYANFDNDAGGETYMGIARKIWPNYTDLWDIIDFYKRTRGEIATNTILPGTLELVKQFYRERWNESRAGEINDQRVANIYYDFYILHSKAVRAMQEVLNEMGYSVTIDNRIGPQTIGAINAADPAKLHDAYKAKRIEMHREQANRYPSQMEFLAGWLQRAAGFPSLTTKGGMAIFVLLGTIAAGYFIYQNSKTQNKKDK